MKIKNEKQFEVWRECGGQNLTEEFPIGPNTSYQLHGSPRRVLFNFSRYKFASKMIGERKKILEFGCSDGFFSQLLMESCAEFLGVDYDQDRIQFPIENYTKENVHFLMDDFMGESYGEFDALVSFDVIEHIYQEDELSFVDTVYENLKEEGIGIIGTPNIRTREFSSEVINKGHINMYDGKRLQELFEKRFHNVFLFSQNDEMIHTGFSPMAHYLIILCCNKK